MNLTQKQYEILRYLNDYIKKHGSSPTYQEIQDHFNWRSSNSAVEHIDRLEKKGALSVRRNVARGIWAVKRV